MSAEPRAGSTAVDPVVDGASRIAGLGVHVAVDGRRRVHVRTAGAGPDLVLLHGLGMSGRDWYNQEHALAGCLRLRAVDLPGHGLSDPCPADVTITDLARDVVDALDGLGVRRFHLLGSSMGGMVAQHVAALVPDRVDRLILHSTTSKVVQRALRIAVESPVAPFIYGMLPLPALARIQLRRMVPDRAARRRYLRGWIEPDRASYLACARACLRHDASEVLPAIRARTLVLSGELDHLFPPVMGRSLAAAIPGARFRELPGSGHASPADAPDLFNAAVLAFLDDPAGEPAG